MGLFDRFQHRSIPISLIAHRNLFLLGIALLLCGLSWSNFLMSLGQLILAGNWILEGRFRTKWKTLKTEPLLWILGSLFLLHLIGLAWTVDFKYGFHDLGIKLPLLALPLILGTSPKLEKAEWKKLMEIYWLSCFLILCVSFGKYFGLFSSELHDKRDYSVYISHIRFGLNIAFAVVSLFYYLPRYQPNIRVLLMGLTGFFIWGLFQLEMITGLSCLLLVSTLAGLRFLVNKRVKLTLRLGLLIVFLGSTFFGVSEFISISQDFYSKKEINFDQTEFIEKTPNGNTYIYNYNSKLHEQGVLLWRFISLDELETGWKKKSTIPFDSLDYKGNTIMSTLVRFLSAKGLKKDSMGFSQLSSQEIRAIEKGIPNPYYLSHNPIQNRIFQSLYEVNQYLEFGQVNGYSLVMRLEYWRNAWRIIESNLLIGVGTGDVKQEIAAQYEKDKSPLEVEYRKRAHNQYLTFWLSFGLLGLILFTAFLLLPLLKYPPKQRLLYAAFLLIACLSFISEDTLETQAGVSFFALFNSLLLLSLPKD